MELTILPRDFTIYNVLISMKSFSGKLTFIIDVIIYIILMKQVNIIFPIVHIKCSFIIIIFIQL
uniref:Uncharacterized protein n=1 Tax=Schistosoma curassoni TaxID=6186 RepID=A0A183KE43_9TREM